MNAVELNLTSPPPLREFGHPWRLRGLKDSQCPQTPKPAWSRLTPHLGKSMGTHFTKLFKSPCSVELTGLLFWLVYPPLFTTAGGPGTQPPTSAPPACLKLRFDPRLAHPGTTPDAVTERRKLDHFFYCWSFLWLLSRNPSEWQSNIKGKSLQPEGAAWVIWVSPFSQQQLW